MARRNVNRANRRRYRRAKNMHVRSGVFPTRGAYARTVGKHLTRKSVAG